MNGKVVCNTGPLVALSMIDRIDILRHLFKLVVVPILVEAKKHGLLDNVGAALQAMREGGYWIGDSIVDAALKQAAET